MKFGIVFASALIGLPLPAPSAAGWGSDRTDLYGDQVPPGSGYRDIVITSQTRHVNVTGGEIINFIVDDKVFSWSFFVGAGTRSFDLNRVAPPGLLDHPVIAYVAPDPRYWGKP